MKLFMTGTTLEEVDLPPVRSLEGKRARLRQHYAIQMPNV